jgi:large subunit ribosomal protein L15
MNQISLHNLTNPDRKSKKRLGRGTGSGLGTTAGRGTKGQNARSGGGVRPRFEGGHTPLFRLLPKARGFTSRFEKAATVNVEELQKHFAAGETVNLQALVKKGLAHSSAKRFKILGEGELSKKLTVYADFISASGKEKITKAGGKIYFVKLPQKPPQKKVSRKDAPDAKVADKKVRS